MIGDTRAARSLIRITLFEHGITDCDLEKRSLMTYCENAELSGWLIGCMESLKRKNVFLTIFNGGSEEGPKGEKPEKLQETVRKTTR